MLPILLKSASFIFLIVLGYFLKVIGVFGGQDYKIPAKIVMNITLPCAVLVSFASYKPDFSLLSLILLGLGMNCLMQLVGYLCSRRLPRRTRAVWLNCVPSYNIGAFAMPFIQSFLSPASLVGACLFDIGNALMCNGTAYAISCNILDNTKGLNLKRIGRTLIRSVPFLTHLTMLMITVFQIPISQKLVDFVTPMANANAFLAMLMVGMMLDLKIEKSIFKEVIGMVIIRFAAAITAGLCFYFLLPLPLEIRQALAIVVFAPVGMVATAFTPLAGGDPAVAACVNSVSILVCIPSMLAMLAVIGVV